jgi:hypothetical protein
LIDEGLTGEKFDYLKYVILTFMNFLNIFASLKSLYKILPFFIPKDVRALWSLFYHSDKN